MASRTAEVKLNSTIFKLSFNNLLLGAASQAKPLHEARMGDIKWGDYSSWNSGKRRLQTPVEVPNGASIAALLEALPEAPSKLVGVQFAGKIYTISRDTVYRTRLADDVSAGKFFALQADVAGDFIDGEDMTVSEVISHVCAREGIPGKSFAQAKVTKKAA